MNLKLTSLISTPELDPRKHKKILEIHQNGNRYYYKKKILKAKSTVHTCTLNKSIQRLYDFMKTNV